MNLNEIEITSHSRLDNYEKCGMLFYNEYVLKNRKPQQADYFIIGNLCHKSLEDYYSGNVGAPIEALNKHWEEFLKKHGIGHLHADLISLSRDIAQLYRRASADYTGADRIRKKGDVVADNPTMTSAWKNAAKELGIDERTNDLDCRALEALDESFIGVSLTNCFAETVNLLTDYRDPVQIDSVEYVEFPLSHRKFENGEVVDLFNAVKLPETGLLLNAYIDLVGRTIPELGGGIVLLDHKTSSSDPPSPIAVAHHEQLLLYSWAWAELTGEWPTHIGINHLRSKTCVVVPVDQERAREVVARREAIIKAQKAGIYLKKDPFAYNSPCLTMRDGAISKACPHLAECHPKVAKDLYLDRPVGPVELKEGF